MKKKHSMDVVVEETSWRWRLAAAAMGTAPGLQADRL